MQVNAVPTLTFSAGTTDFCRRTSPAETVVTVAFMVIAGLCAWISPVRLDRLDYFHLYKLPWSARWQSVVIGFGTGFSLLPLLLMLRRAMDHHDQRRKARRIAPSFGVSGGHSFTHD